MCITTLFISLYCLQIKHANSDDLWTGVGKEAGIRIWRIVKFEVAKPSYICSSLSVIVLSRIKANIFTLIIMKVTDWPKEQYGEFHEDDSYIVLNSHKIQELSQVVKRIS